MLLLLLLAAVSGAHCLDNGVGVTPAMGYNSWNDFRCNGITAAHIEEVADKMAALGLDKVGYKYVNIDDCWAKSRNSKGVIQPDSSAFPNGMKAVADYIHSKGFKFGIYTDRGNLTCAGRPGSLNHEQIDAETYASWGVDYLKEDSCWATQDHDQAFAEYGKMRDALNKTGRHIYFSLCGWNSWYAPPGWSLGNSWRIGGDVNLWPSVYNSIRINEKLAKYARPGGWNDPDMLVGSSPNAAVHNTPNQSRTQFSLWAVMAAPLLIGSNVLNMSAWDLQTYTNTEVIAIDQDPAGEQGVVIQSNCPPYTPPALGTSKGGKPASDAGLSGVDSCQQIWAKKLHNGDYAVNMVNFATTPATITCGADCFKALGMATASVRDVWLHKDLGTKSSFAATVEGNGDSRTLIFSKQS